MLFLGNGVDITVSGTHSIVKVSQADPTVSGETTPSAYTMTQGTDYTMTYTPTGSNQGIENRTVTVTITGIGKFSGQTKTVTYTQKADTACTTASTCTPSTSYTYSSYSVSYNGDDVACNAEPSKSNITVTADKTTTTKDVFCQESSTTENGVSITDFSVSYSPSGNNNGTSSRTVTGTVTHNGSTAGTFTFTQNSGATCYSSTDVTGSTTEYEISVSCGNIGNCDTTASPTVSGRSKTGVTHTTGATVWDDWGNWTTLTSSDYSLSYSPTLAANDTASEKTYTVTATGLGVYDGKTASTTFTQAAGPCGGGGGDTGTTSCTCSVSSVTVSPTTHTYTSTTEEKEFTVTITDNDCSGCTGGFKVYNSIGTEVANGTSSFKITNGDGTYTIKADDDTSKTATLTLTKYTSSGGGGGGDTGTTSCTCSVSSVTVSPTSYEYTSTTEEKEFTVTVTDNDCSGCTGGFKVYDSSGTEIANGTSSFKITNGDGTYTIKADDDTSKTATLTLTKFVDNSCTCSVTDISVSPTSYEYTSADEEKEFTVTITDNDCSGCTSGFKVYDSSGTEVANGTSSFKITNGDGTYTIKADDDTSKTCEVTLTEYVYNCTCSVTDISVSPTSYEYTSTTEEKEFTVTITDNDCSGCTGGFKVYNSIGTEVANGTSSFKITNGDGTYTIKANDDTSKTCEITLTEYVDNSCTCSVTSISVEPSSYTLTSATDSKSFDVTVTDNDCSGCTGGWAVYNSSGTRVTSGTGSSFSLNTAGTYTIKANDNTSKTDTVTVNAFVDNSCTCSVTDISVSPTTHTYTSADEEKEFTVTITDNDCSGCTSGFKVYDSSGTEVANGTSSFKITNGDGTYTIKADDDTSKTATLTLTKYTAPVAPSYEFEVSTSSINIDNWVYGQGGFVYVKSRKNGSALSVSNTSSDFITVSATTNDNSSYDYKYLIIVEANNGTSYRDGSITFTQSETNDTKSISVTQIFNPYVDVTFSPTWTDGDITVASDFSARYTEYGKTVYYGAGNGSDDGNWTLTWNYTPTYSGNAGSYNALIYYWDYATVCGQTITVSACYNGGSHGERCGNDSGTGPTYTPPTPIEPYLDKSRANWYLVNPLGYKVSVTLHHVISGSMGVVRDETVTQSVAANSEINLTWPTASGNPAHTVTIEDWNRDYT